MSRLKRLILPILLLALAMGLEIVGIILCGEMLPDYKNEVFTEEKKNITQLIFVDDDDNSRFYPWLSYHEDEMVPAQSYIESHLYDQSLNIFLSNLDIDIYSLDDDTRKKIIISGINRMILSVIEKLDSDNLPNNEPDFYQSVKFDNNATIMCLKDFKYITQNNETKLFDLVMRLSGCDILYFRIRSENPAKPTSQEISQKNKELLEDVEETFAYLAKLLSGEQDVNNKEEVQEPQQMNYSKKDSETDYKDNIICNYLISVNMQESYIENGNYVFSTTTDDKFDFPIRVVISSVIFSSQYTIFSNGDELMVFLSGTDNISKYSDTILYYSISENKITGFSLKRTF